MPPINPIEILDAFAPLLTDTGGIKQVDEPQYLHLYSIMKEYSTKLVSRCIYCKILMSTSPDVLEQFLKIGVWDLIGNWTKASKDDGNVAFLVDLLKLLYSLPMNIDRLRENECPKIVKKLCKHENEEIAQKASQIIKKWTKIITASAEKSTASGQNGAGKVAGNASSTNNAKEKKRKVADGVSTNNNNASSGETSKKTKVTHNNNTKSLESDKTDKDSGESNSTLNDVDPYETFSRDDMNKFMVNKAQEPPKARPATAKVKPGKFRLDLTGTSDPKPGVKAKKKGTDLKDAKADAKKVALSKAMPVTGNGALKVPKSTASSTNSTTVVTSPHVLKDSMSFMDALSVMPTVANKKRRKLNKECDSAPTNKVSNSQEVKVDLGGESLGPPSGLVVPPSYGNSNHDANSGTSGDNSLGGSNVPVSSSAGPMPPSAETCLDQKESSSKQQSEVSEEVKSPPRFSFYKDILEESKSEEDTSTSTSTTSRNTTIDDQKVDSSFDNKCELKEQSTSSPESSCEATASVQSPDEKVALTTEHQPALIDSTFKPKSILTIVKKGSKKSVRWPDDDADLEKVRFFELDETERINVSRPSADMKRFDMQHEAQLLMEAKKRVVTYIAWRLIPIYVDPENTPVEKGKNSKERDIQAALQKTTLECFYLANQIPDCPREADLEYTDNEPPKVIPLDDDSLVEKVNDYSSMNMYSQSPMQTDAGYPSYNPVNDNFPPMGNNAYNPPALPNSQYPIPPASSINNHYMSSPSTNFDGANPNPTYSYNSTNFSNASVNSTNNSLPPAIFSNTNSNNMFSDFPPPTSTYGQGSLSSNNHINPSVSPGSPPNMFNQNQPPNFFNQPMSQQQQQPPPSNNDTSPFNSFWPDSNNMPPANNFGGGGPGGPFMAPQQHPGPRFHGGRGGRGGRGGFHKKGGDNICRFWIKYGKCKFDTRCNFLHAPEAKGPRF